MAFIEYGLSEDEFFLQPPYKFLLHQLREHRKSERRWEHTRLLAASMYNASGRSKRRIKPKDIILLDIDRKVKRWEYDQRAINKAIEKWN